MFPDDLRIWLNHFEYHAEHPRCLPADLADVLRPEERCLIASSIATFQLGEQSQGGTLVRAADHSWRVVPAWRPLTNSTAQWRRQT